MQPLHPIMLAGTGSDVGKSLLATGLCRIFRQDGYHPAPFKAQNMALNSFATPEGLEIGRAQAVQAEAAGIDCHTDMNPLLLKPNSDHTSQIVLNGRPMGNTGAYDYFRSSPERDELRRQVCQAYDRLASRYNPIVIEGAGSIAEINLRHTDLVNMPMAIHAGAHIILVGDIDRGGVFASVYGSIMLQSPEDRPRIRGIIINKFRGDLRLFNEGRHMLEQLCHVPVLGVVPYITDIHIDEEDSMDLAAKSFAAGNDTVNIAVVLLKHISNYTDFNALEYDTRTHLYYTDKADEIAKADIIILPGTKSTISDLNDLRHNGCAKAIVQAHRQGKTIVGICGGYQMMGLHIEDPHHTEGPTDHMPGLGLLPVTTTIGREKITRQVTFNNNMHGYEIHMGTTILHDGAQPLNVMADGRQEGCMTGPRCMGTYIHGILDNPAFVDQLLAPFAHRNKTADQAPQSYESFRQEQYDKLADHIRQHVDIEQLYHIMTTPSPQQL